MCGRVDAVLYALPALPLLVRFAICLRYRQFMGEQLSDEALDRADHRTIVGALGGFSFAGLFALVALPGMEERRLAIWFVLVSSLCLLATLNLQSYKALRWHDMVGDALLDTANLSLVAAVAVFIARSELSLAFKVASATLAFAVWISDFVIRVRLTAQFLEAKEAHHGK